MSVVNARQQTPLPGGAAAWDARSFVDKAVGRELRDDALSLAVNSPRARSQNQLRIHIDCIHADVRSALVRNGAKIGERWSLLDTLLGGHRLQAIRVTGTTLAGHNPFKLLAEGVPSARACMGQHTLVVAGMSFAGEQGWLCHPCGRCCRRLALAGSFMCARAVNPN